MYCVVVLSGLEDIIYQVKKFVLISLRNLNQLYPVYTCSKYILMSRSSLQMCLSCGPFH